MNWVFAAAVIMLFFVFAAFLAVVTFELWMDALDRWKWRRKR